MTITTVRAAIRRIDPTETPWFVAVWVEERDGHLITHRLWRFDWCATHARALEAAGQARAAVEQELMDEVHARRASRRIERCELCESDMRVNGQLECVCGASKAAHLAQHPHATLPHRDNPFDTCFGYHEASSVHTIEATA